MHATRRRSRHWLLKRLKKRFYLVAMTNSDNWALSHFAKTLDQPFDDLVTAEMVGWNKPDSQVFAYTRGRLSKEGYGFADILHVAQSQYHDIEVAMRLGYQTCWIERRMGKTGAGATPVSGDYVKPHYHFGSLVELADKVDGSWEMSVLSPCPLQRQRPNPMTRSI